MRKCPACGAEYEVGDAICARCGAELPAPYEQRNAGDDESDGYDTGDFANPLPPRQAAADGDPGQPALVRIAEVTPQEAATFGRELHWAGVRYLLYPPPEAPNFRQLLAERTGGKIYILTPEEDAAAAWQVLARARLSPEQITILSGAEVIVGDTTFNPGTLVLAEGHIIEVLNFAIPDPRDGSTFLDLSGKVVSAGFIDVHTHGMMGIDANEATPADFLRLSREAARFGITALLPSTVACPPQELRRIMEQFREARRQPMPGARLLGLHVESNFINPQFKGAQPPAYLFSPEHPEAVTVKQLLEEFAEETGIVTLAPELPGALGLIGWLTERGIIASLGHSAADYDQAIAGIEAGATHATHLFNAMPPLHHRNPGLVGAALERDEVFVEMICDGIHVHPAMVSMTISAKGSERFMPVSDSLRAAGMGTGDFTLGGQHVSVRDGVARLDNGTIAGSVTTMDAIVRFMVDTLGWDMGEALLMAATTPADGLGLADMGRIAQGAPADLVVLDQNLQVAMTLVAGKVVYQG